jgi:hypothetical protein
VIVTQKVAASVTEHARRILDSHLNVGREKPVSYLPIRTVEEVLGITVPGYRSMIAKLGNQSSVFSADECCIKSGAVYAYSYSDLGDFLQQNQVILYENGWPAIPADFIRRIASEWLDDENPILSVVRKAFGEG